MSAPAAWLLQDSLKVGKMGSKRPTLRLQLQYYNANKHKMIVIYCKLNYLNNCPFPQPAHHYLQKFEKSDLPVYLYYFAEQPEMEASGLVATAVKTLRASSVPTVKWHTIDVL